MLALVLASELRKAGLSAEIDLGGRGLKGQFKHADRIGARRVLILEQDGAQLRDMSSGEQRPVDTGNLLAEISGGEA
jgi:histidyl-tRNA synthetase